MPSILATAALAALAGSGGRKLDGSGVGPCTHDICGRKLLVRDSIHGNPSIGDEYKPAQGLYLNNHNFVGLHAGTVKVVNDKIQVSVDFDANYDHTVRQCKLIVTPSIVEGANVATTVTSKTFNPSTNGDTVYASVSKQESLDVDGTTRIAPTEITSNLAQECLQFASHSGGECHKLTVELDDPVLDQRSLGYLSTDLKIELDCLKNGAGNQETKELTVAFQNTNQVRVLRTYKEDDITNLEITPGDVTVTEAAQWGNKASRTDYRC